MKSDPSCSLMNQLRFDFLSLIVPRSTPQSRIVCVFQHFSISSTLLCLMLSANLSKEEARALLMALRLGICKATACSRGSTFGLLRCIHVAAMPPPLDGVIHSSIAPPPTVLPEFNRNLDGCAGRESDNLEFGLPGFAFNGSMELMAVPKKKVSKHKRGIRNGPKALKPTPVIVRCRSCGRVKLPHFYCCSGDRGTSEQNS